jgi:hypothetical protein
MSRSRILTGVVVGLTLTVGLPLAAWLHFAAPSASQTSPRPAGASAHHAASTTPQIEELRTRPLRRPAVGTTATNCPVSSPTSLRPTVATGVAPHFGYGPGPEYFSGITAESLSTRGLNNALILADPSYTGDVLLRGTDAAGRLLGFAAEPRTPLRQAVVGGRLLAHVMAFGYRYATYDAAGVPPGTEAPNWRRYFVHVHAPAVGCYALQLDSRTGSATVIVRASGDPFGPPSTPTA